MLQKRYKYSALVSVIAATILFCMGCSVEHRLNSKELNRLDTYRWHEYVDNGQGIWISVKRQTLTLIDDHKIVRQYPCSTAAAGTGSQMNSGQTPLGWHRVDKKIGQGLPEGAVLKDRIWTGRIWKRKQPTDNDLILSRILWLDGLQPGYNQGGEVDSRNRYIYIHGTNRIDALGHPASAGCIRLDPQAVIDLYERVDEGCHVLITLD